MTEDNTPTEGTAERCCLKCDHWESKVILDCEVYGPCNGLGYPPERWSYDWQVCPLFTEES